MFDFSGLNEAQKNRWGEKCVLTTSTGDYIKDGIFSAPHVEKQAGGVIIYHPDTTMSFLAGDINDINLARRDEILVRDTTYTVDSIEPDSEGMTVVSLRGSP